MPNLAEVLSELSTLQRAETKTLQESDICLKHELAS